ncbi:MAG: Bifunctional protein Aas [Catillopecten margaritatus gill symbiont]|uniref:Bifunctional protein Aas n=1 Tax=Catillopecten margaritatus gill symbiont TaxID=3083288 RepID=A0AAU6PHZ9_9GAMM
MQKILKPVHISWLQHAKQKGDYASCDISTGIKIERDKFLIGVLLFADVIKKTSPEQNIGLMVPSSTGGAITTMSVLSLGKTAVNLNFTAGKKSLQDAAQQADLKTLYTSKKLVIKLLEKKIDIINFFPNLNIIYLEEVKESISILKKIKFLFLSKILSAKSIEKFLFNKVDGNDTAAILFSSGSEGSPKGIELSHNNLSANARQAAIVLNTQPGKDVMMSTLPTFHSFGFLATTLMPLAEGVPIACHPDPTDVVAIAKGIEKFKGSILIGTPTFLRMYSLNKRIKPQMLSSLRLVVSGAEKLKQETAEDFQKKFNKTIYQGYGATETSPAAGINTPAANKSGTVGKPLTDTQYKIVDIDTLKELPIEEDGLILIGGPQVMKGYLKQPDKTRQVITMINGIRWYNTGDKGHLDNDGFLTIVDRYSRFAKIGGEMVSLSALEEQIQHSMHNAEMELLSVVVSDAKKGEKIVLLVTEDIQMEDIKKALLADNISALMHPSKIIKVDEIPKLGSGKTDFGTAKKIVEV